MHLTVEGPALRSGEHFLHAVDHERFGTFDVDLHDVRRGDLAVSHQRVPGRRRDGDRVPGAVSVDRGGAVPDIVLLGLAELDLAHGVGERGLHDLDVPQVVSLDIAPEDLQVRRVRFEGDDRPAGTPPGGEQRVEAGVRADVVDDVVVLDRGQEVLELGRFRPEPSPIPVHQRRRRCRELDGRTVDCQGVVSPGGHRPAVALGVELPERFLCQDECALLAIDGTRAVGEGYHVRVRVTGALEYLL